MLTTLEVIHSVKVINFTSSIWQLFLIIFFYISNWIGIIFIIHSIVSIFYKTWISTSRNKSITYNTNYKSPLRQNALKMSLSIFIWILSVLFIEYTVCTFSVGMSFDSGLILANKKQSAEAKSRHTYFCYLYIHENIFFIKIVSFCDVSCLTYDLLLSYSFFHLLKLHFWCQK